MPYTMEDLERDAAQTVLSKLTPEQRLQGLPPEALLAHLTTDQLRGPAAQQLLAMIPVADIQNYLKEIQATSKADCEQP